MLPPSMHMPVVMRLERSDSCVTCTSIFSNCVGMFTVYMFIFEKCAPVVLYEPDFLEGSEGSGVHSGKNPEMLGVFPELRRPSPGCLATCCCVCFQASSLRWCERHSVRPWQTI